MNKIFPYGNRKDSSSLVKKAFSLDIEDVDDNIDDIGDDPLDSSFKELSEEEDSLLTDDVGKVQQVENALDEILGSPTLDNLMVILTAIGMKKVQITMSEDDSQISLSGIINLKEDDQKITKE